MRKLSIWKFAALAGLAASAPAIAGSDKVLYGPVPDWVPPAPAPEVAGNPAGGAARVVYNEVETRLDDSGSHTFTGYRVALLAPEALAAGNINLVWNPSSATETVHYLRVHRDGQVIDVLKTSPFAIYQREGKLEQAMLDGLLTANLQIPGLRVGDEIEFAATLDERDPVFPASEYGALFLADQVAPGTYRLGLQWSPDREPKIQVTSALQPAIERTGTRVSATLTDPAAFVAPTDAPARYAMGRLIEYSNFDGWADISRTFFPLYRDAAKLAAVPGLDERIAAIASEHPDAKGRARAALALVQQSVRYVYTGMNGGNWIPAPAATTWDRRFADCKGVTALLLGILERLGIAAEPVLVASNAASPIDRLLPSPAAFDHVLVRIVVDGKPYWLDGTRMGDDRLLTNQEIAFRWGLPVSAAGSALEPIAHSAPRMPSDLTFLDIDARAGVESKAKVHMVEVTRGGRGGSDRNSVARDASGDRSRAVEAFVRGRLAVPHLGCVDLQSRFGRAGIHHRWRIGPRLGNGPDTEVRHDRAALSAARRFQPAESDGAARRPGPERAVHQRSQSLCLRRHACPLARDAGQELEPDRAQDRSDHRRSRLLPAGQPLAFDGRDGAHLAHGERGDPARRSGRLQSADQGFRQQQGAGVHVARQVCRHREPGGWQASRPRQGRLGQRRRLLPGALTSRKS
jgi:hypothetical protein